MLLARALAVHKKWGYGPAEAVACATLVCDTAMLKGDREGHCAASPLGFQVVAHWRVWGAAWASVFLVWHSQHGLGQDTGTPCPLAMGCQQHPHLPSIAPCPAAAPQQVFTAGLQWWLWRNDGQLGEVEVSKDCHCTKASHCSQICPIFPQIWGFCGAGGPLSSTHGC